MNKYLRIYSIELFVFVLFIVYAGILNCQFLEGSNVNYTFSGHDEYLTVREVYSILNPASFKHFALAVSAGDVMFYGRAMFYTDALVAWLPYKIWGLTGMIYAIRMMHALCLVLGVLLLARTFLSKSLSRVLFYASVLSFYYTAYFIMIPKPEPLQLLVLAIFLFYGNKANWNFGKHFIWIGIAYGLKFNVLMVLPIFFIIPFFTRTFNIRKAIVSGLYVLMGIVIAVPSLLLSPIRPIYLKTYISSTFGNTYHYDDTVVSFFEWLNKGLFSWYGGHIVSGVVIFVVFLGIVFWLAYRLLFKKELNTTLIISAMAFCFLIPVMLLTKRLWPHYLWTGSVFMMLSVLMYFDTSKSKKIISTSLNAILLLCFFILLSFSIRNISSLFQLEFKADKIIRDSKKAQEYLSAKSGQIVCLQDISVYLPFKDFVSTYRYHPFSSAYPYPLSHKKFVWSKSGFINPKNIKDTRANYILNYRTNFELRNTKKISSKDQLMENYNEQMRALLNKTLFLDTLIGEVRVYKVSNENFN
jgi:hypothetical protein